MNILEQHTKFKKGELYRKSGVYVITNVNNKKVYVGESTNLESRIIEHLRRLLSKRHVNDYLQNSVNLHGIGSFQFDILEFCDSIDTKKKEHYWATCLHALDKTKGYNIKPTDPNKINLRSKETNDKITATKRLRAAERGYWFTKESIEARTRARKGYKHSEETKNKIGQKSIGRKNVGRKKQIPKIKLGFTEESRRKISEANKGCKRTEEFKNNLKKIHSGKKLSEETKEKIRQANLGKKMSKSNRTLLNKAIKKPILRFTKKNIFIDEFESITDAINFLNIKNDGSIGAVCSGKRKTAHNYIWKYKKDYNEKM
jgi:group I intron endonuclease